jgi:phosphoglycerate kinase
MHKRYVQDLAVEGQRVLLRVDFNVPIEAGQVKDDSRLLGAIPTIQYLMDHRARVILCSHLDRPGGEVVETLRMDPIADRLQGLLGLPVHKLDGCVGPEVQTAADELEPGSAILLENIRFHPQELENDEAFARQLAELADIYVNDAFATAHRRHASTEGVAHHLPSAVGTLMRRELEQIDRILEQPRHPYIALFGGVKLATKIGAIHRMQTVIDGLMIGGAMANTFLRARGDSVGASLLDEDCLAQAEAILHEMGDRLLLPEDVVAAQCVDLEAEHRVCDVSRLPDGWHIVDIGPKTIERFQEKLLDAKMILWNGPMGVFELGPFARGTRAMALAIGNASAVTIVGGGETGAAVRGANTTEKYSHISTGGGAFLTYLESGDLPALEPVDEAMAQENG